MAALHTPRLISALVLTALVLALLALLPSPRPVKADSTMHAIQVATYDLATCVLWANGRVTCWWDSSLNFSPLPATSTFTTIAVGASFVCGSSFSNTLGISNGNGIICSGDNSLGQTSPGFTSSVKSIIAGQTCACGFSPASLALCWGQEAGALMNLNYAQSTPNVGSVLQVSFSSSAAVYIGSAGAQFVGTGTTCMPYSTSSVSPQYNFVSNAMLTVKSDLGTSLGTFSGAALSNTALYLLPAGEPGALYVMGTNGRGQLGTGAPATATACGGSGGSATVRVPVPSPVSKVVAGGDFACANTTTGVFCWGANDYGQAGVGSSTDVFTVPSTPVALGDCVPVDLAAGQYHVCVVCSNGGVKCWGRGTGSRLGPWNAAYGGRNWGDQPNEMGFALPYAETATSAPSKSPSTRPTFFYFPPAPTFPPYSSSGNQAPPPTGLDAQDVQVIGIVLGLGFPSVVLFGIFSYFLFRPELKDDKIRQLGGEVFCCLRDVNALCMGCCCGPCQLAESVARVSGGSCLWLFCLLTFCWPCCGSACVAVDMAKANELWGGKRDWCHRFWCILCCPQLTSMQMARAVKKRNQAELHERNAFMQRLEALEAGFVGGAFVSAFSSSALRMRAGEHPHYFGDGGGGGGGGGGGVAPEHEMIQVAHAPLPVYYAHAPTHAPAHAPAHVPAPPPFYAPPVTESVTDPAKSEAARTDVALDIELAEELVAFYASRPDAAVDLGRPQTVVEAFRLIQAFGVRKLAARLEERFGDLPKGWRAELQGGARAGSAPGRPVGGAAPEGGAPTTAVLAPSPMTEPAPVPVPFASVAPVWSPERGADLEAGAKLG